MAFFRTFSAFKNVFKPKSFKFDDDFKFEGAEVEELFPPSSSQYGKYLDRMEGFVRLRVTLLLLIFLI